MYAVPAVTEQELEEWSRMWEVRMRAFQAGLKPGVSLAITERRLNNRLKLRVDTIERLKANGQGESNGCRQLIKEVAEIEGLFELAREGRAAHKWITAKTLERHLEASKLPRS